MSVENCAEGRVVDGVIECAAHGKPWVTCDGEEAPRPLREIFPTANGKRLRPCPWCSRPMHYSGNDGGYVCHNQAGHEGQMFADAERVVFV